MMGDNAGVGPWYAVEGGGWSCDCIVSGEAVATVYREDSRWSWIAMGPPTDGKVTARAVRFGWPMPLGLAKTLARGAVHDMRGR